MTIDPSEIGKHPELIKKAQTEMAQSDVLVCGKCHNVFHFIELFQEHKESNCKQASALKDSRETKPKVWAFLLWKASQLNVDDNANVNAWKLYQTWIKLDESVRETWLVAGRTIQSFARFGNGSLQEMPVKITRTIVESPEKKVLTTANQQNAIRKVVPVTKPVVEQKLIKTAGKRDDNSFMDAEEELSKIKENQVVRKNDISPSKPTIIANKVLNRTAIRSLPSGNESEEHDIEKILAKRFNPRKKGHEYLIKWSNLPQSANTWEPVKHIEDCKDLLDIFETQLAKQKEQRAKQGQNASAGATKTPGGQPSPMVTSTPIRPIRFSKAKAIDQVKQWVSSTSAHHSDGSPGSKRKYADEESDYDDDADSSFDERKNKSDPVVIKKLRTDNAAVNEALIKAGSTGNVRIMQVNKSGSSPVTLSKTVNGGATVTKFVSSSKPNTDVLITKDQKQQSGVFKKSTIPTASPKSGDGQVKIIDKNDSITSGIVRISTVTTSTTAKVTPGGIKTGVISSKISPTVVRPNQPGIVKAGTPVVKQVIQRVVQKPELSNVRPGQRVTTPTTTTKVIQPIQQAQKRLGMNQAGNFTTTPGGTLIRRTITGPKTVTQTVTKKVISSPQSGVKVVRKVLPNVGQTPANITKRKSPDEEDDGVPDAFPKDLPPLSGPPSPPRPLTLCPITGEVLSKAEGEISPNTNENVDSKPVSAPPGKAIIRPKPQSEKALVQAKEEEEIAEDVQQIQHFLTNEDGSPIFITGDDGTIYQVAGKNANGETVLLTQGPDGEQTCVLLSPDQDFLGLPVQQEDESQLSEEAMTVDAAVAEAVALGEIKAGSDGDSQDDNSQESTQPLSIQIAGGDTDSQDGQITAEIVQADLPSPGGTRKVVLLLPDGSLMMTDVSDEQFQSLNIQN